MKTSLYLFFGLLFNCLLLGNGLARQKPQVILMTDIGGDTDDEQRLTRFSGDAAQALQLHYTKNKSKISFEMPVVAPGKAIHLI